MLARLDQNNREQQIALAKLETTISERTASRAIFDLRINASIDALVTKVQALEGLINAPKPARKILDLTDPHNVILIIILGGMAAGKVDVLALLKGLLP